MDKSQGLVNGYLTQVRQLAAQHQCGESLDALAPKMKVVLVEARDHIAIWKNGTPEENWAFLIGQIGFNADLSGEEKFKTAMNQARGIAKELDAPKRK